MGFSFSCSHSVMASSDEISSFNLRINLAGPVGGPLVKRDGQNGCMTTMLRNSFTRERHTYAAIMADNEVFAVASNKSVNAVSSVAPCIMCAVEAKSGISV